MTGNSVGQYYEAKMTYFQGSFSVGVMFLHVIFHKRMRVFYQGFQTRENNGIHEGVYQAIFIVLENL